MTNLDKKIQKSHSNRITEILSIRHSRKAISEVIVSLLLLAITVIGGTFVFIIFSDNSLIGDISSSTTSAQKASGSLKLTGFDTRDGANLYNITAIDNASIDGLTSGEHIVLKIRNDSPNSIFLENVQINDVTHTSDISGSVVTNTVPASGTYGIVDVTCTSSCTLATSTEIGDGKEVRLVVKLSSSVGTISLNKTVRSTITYGGLDPTTFIIPAGSMR